MSKYYVDGWGYKWWVMARNHKSVARCNTKKWADKIAALLNQDES